MSLDTAPIAADREIIGSYAEVGDWSAVTGVACADGGAACVDDIPDVPTNLGWWTFESLMSPYGTIDETAVDVVGLEYAAG